MPGIAGIIAKHKTGEEANMLNSMVQIMLHESFYTSGTHANNERGIYIGHVCINDSFPDCMPIYNEEKNIILFFSGECFDDPEIIARLKHKGHAFSPGNASYLIHLYEELGENFFIKLNGWFSGIILDIKQGKAILFNDRYGIQRIYYHENDKAFFFSSEAKSLLKVLPYLREIDLESIGEYVTFDCVLKNRTYFSNINLLPPGSAWTFINGNAEKKKYFDSSILENQPILDKQKFYSTLEDTFKKIIPRYLSGKSIGMALTGGFDTRMVMSCINPQPGQLPCFTFGGMYRDNFDVRLAPQIAKACHQTHQVIRLDEEILADFPSHAERATFLTDGLSDVCSAEMVHLNHLARQIAPIKLTGHFGSQAVRGVNAFRDRTPDQRLINEDFKEYLSMAKNSLSDYKGEHNFSFFLFKTVPWSFANITVAELSQLMVRSPFLDNNFVKVLYQAPPGALDSPEHKPSFHLYVIKNNNPKLLKIRTNAGILGDSTSFLSKPAEITYRVLSKFDKALNWDKLPYSAHHWIARLDYLLSPIHAARLFLGFEYYHHHRLWFRNELSQYLKDMLLDSRTLNRPYWNKNFVKKVVHDHIYGRGSYLPEIRKILTIELIHRILIENI